MSQAECAHVYQMDVIILVPMVVFIQNGPSANYVFCEWIESERGIFLDMTRCMTWDVRNGSGQQWVCATVVHTCTEQKNVAPEFYWATK